MTLIDNKERLWIEYTNTKSSEIREKIIVEYISLVKIVAGRLGIYLASYVEYEDLVSYGIFGLIDAIDKFDYNKGIKFETYASLRIRGAILDQIRKMDWIPRSVRQKQKSIDAAIKKLESEQGPSFSDEDVANELGITIEEYNNWQGQTNINNVSSLEDYMEQGNDIKSKDVSVTRTIEPESVAMDNSLRESISYAMNSLTENERKVVLLYYYEELTLREISKVLEVSESRVSQLHSKALKKMKNILDDDFRIMMG